jgi:hypothetical protein
MSSGFAVPPVGWLAVFLDKALYLDLHVEASQQDAASLVETLTHAVITADVGRKNQRGIAGTTKIRQAVVAIVGGVLRAWIQDGSPVYRSNHADAFTPMVPRSLSQPFHSMGLKPDEHPQVVGRRAFTTVIGVLKAQGLLHHKEGVRFPLNAMSRMGQGSKGKSSRYWPTKALLELVRAHGLAAATVVQAFPAPRPKRALKQAALVRLQPFRRKPWAPRHDAAEPRLPSLINQPDQADILKRLIADVAEQNELAARCEVTAPPEILLSPPQWRRVFRGDLELQGRWYAIGGDRQSGLGQPAAYLNLPAHQRAELRINGEAVIELDAKASHLSLLIGLTEPWSIRIGLRSDPYAGILVQGQPLHRDVVKQYVVETCGKGHPPQRWSSKLAPDHPARTHRPREIGPAIIERFPVLRDPTVIIPPSLIKMTGKPARQLVAHYLAGLEAQALTMAMRWLRMRNILALPVHDSLIVPMSARREAQLAIEMGYAGVCGLEPAVRGKNFTAQAPLALDPIE